MAFKFVLALAFIAAASAGYVPTHQVYQAYSVALHAAPVAVAQKVVVKSEEYDTHPQYKYSYGVEDKLTGDSKSQVEERDGDVVCGEYSLIAADGYKRTVQYTADDRNGFNAVVQREPLVKNTHTIIKSVAPVAHFVTPTVVKTVTQYLTPTVVKTVAPVARYAAPDHYTSYAAPRKYTSYAASSYYH